MRIFQLLHANETLIAQGESIKALQKRIENLEMDFTKAKQAYVDQCAELQADNKRLREKIDKKVQYLAKKEEGIDFKQAYKEKLYGKLLGTKHLSTYSTRTQNNGETQT